MNALVTAVIPTYNYSGFIARAIESALAQTYRPIECIVVDDGSTDDTAAALAPFGSRVTVIRQTHRGIAAARNTAIAAASGDYIALLDADDEWHPTKIERQIEFLAARPSVGCVGCGLIHVMPDGRTDTRPGRRNTNDRQATLRWVAQRRFWVLGSGSGAVIRRSVLAHVGPFDETLEAAEDWDMWLRMAAAGGIDNVPDVLVSIHRHGTGVFRNARLVEANQWKVYHKTIRRWPTALTTVDRRRMRAMILGDAARECTDLAEALSYHATALAAWPFNRRRAVDAAAALLRWAANPRSRAALGYEGGTSRR